MTRPQQHMHDYLAQRYGRVDVHDLAGGAVLLLASCGTFRCRMHIEADGGARPATGRELRAIRHTCGTCGYPARMPACANCGRPLEMAA